MRAGQVFECSSGLGLNRADDAKDFLLASIKRHTGDHPHTFLCQWNDAPERTHGQVMAAFDWAIADATPKGESA